MYTPLTRCKLKKNDKVQVIAGRDKGKTGTIISINFSRSLAYVKDVNMVKKAVKKRSQEQQGGIISVEAPIHTSNIKLSAQSTGSNRKQVRKSNKPVPKTTSNPGATG